MWPSFSPSQKCIYVRVPICIDVPHWFDYDAEIRLWIYLYIDHAGHARGYVAWYGAWVEGGVKSGAILDRLMNEIPNHTGAVNQRIVSALQTLDAFTFQRLYYLPGEAHHTGHINDDVSIVLVKEL